MRSLLLGGMLTAGMMFAADGLRMESPVLGYIFDDEAKAIRVVTGIPGAAGLGASLALPALTDATVHSGAKLALVVTKEGRLGLASWRDTERIVPLETSLGAARMVAFSRSGAHLAISDGVAVEVWSTAETPVRIRVGSEFGAITAVAVNDAGVVLAAAAGRIARWNGEAVETVAAGDWTAVAYAADGDGIAVDLTRSELVRITAEGGRLVLAALPGRTESLATSDAGELFAAGAWGALSISADGVVEPLACDCQPTGLDGMAGGAVHLRGTSILADLQAGLRLTPLPSRFVLQGNGNNEGNNQ